MALRNLAYQTAMTLGISRLRAFVVMVSTQGKLCSVAGFTPTGIHVRRLRPH